MKPKPAGMKAEHFLFCRELIRNEFADPADAYSKAYPGTTPGSAAAGATRLLKSVKEVQVYLTEVATKSVDATNIEARHIIERMLSIAFTNITDVASWSDEKGLMIKPSADIPAHHLGAIQEIIERTTMNESRLSIKLHNPVRPLQLLGQYLRMFSPDEPDRSPDDGTLQTITEIVVERPELPPASEDDKPKAKTQPKRRRRKRV